MSKGKTWVLLANWVDVSLLRNQIVLDMSREIGLKHAAGCVQADVWINGIYNGLYLITEKIQIGGSRIDIINLEKATEKVNVEPFSPGQIITEKSASFPLLRSYPAVKDPEDITGGYILTIEKKHRMKDYVLAGFRTKEDLSIRIKEPTYPSRAQTEYLFGRMTEVQKALMAKDGIEPATGKSYDEYLDMTSFAQRFLIEDWTRTMTLSAEASSCIRIRTWWIRGFMPGRPGIMTCAFGNMADRGYEPQREIPDSLPGTRTISTGCCYRMRLSGKGCGDLARRRSVRRWRSCWEKRKRKPGRISAPWTNTGNGSAIPCR